MLCFDATGVENWFYKCFYWLAAIWGLTVENILEKYKNRLSVLFTEKDILFLHVSTREIYSVKYSIGLTNIEKYVIDS